MPDFVVNMCGTGVSMASLAFELLWSAMSTVALGFEMRSIRLLMTMWELEARCAVSIRSVMVKLHPDYIVIGS